MNIAVTSSSTLLRIRSVQLLIIVCSWGTLSCLPTMSHAEWDGGIEGGSVISDGGSSTRLRAKLTNLERPFTQTIYADWIRSNSGDNSYEVGYKPRFWITDPIYLFGDLKLRVDKPLLIDRDVFILGGAGIQVFYSSERSLWLEGGVGLRNTEFDNGSDTEDDLALVRGGFHQVLADLVRFELDIDAYSGSERLETTTEAGISLRVSGGALKYSYRIRQVRQDDLPTVETSDAFVSFSYGF